MIGDTGLDVNGCSCAVLFDAARPDGALDSTIWTVNSGTVTIDGGRIKFAGGAGKITSKAATSKRFRNAVIGLATGSLGGGAAMKVNLDDPRGNYVRFTDDGPTDFVGAATRSDPTGITTCGAGDAGQRLWIATRDWYCADPSLDALAAGIMGPPLFDIAPCSLNGGGHSDVIGFYTRGGVGISPLSSPGALSIEVSGGSGDVYLGPIYFLQSDAGDEGPCPFDIVGGPLFCPKLHASVTLALDTNCYNIYGDVVGVDPVATLLNGDYVLDLVQCVTTVIKWQVTRDYSSTRCIDPDGASPTPGTFYLILQYGGCSASLGWQITVGFGTGGGTLYFPSSASLCELDSNIPQTLSLGGSSTLTVNSVYD